MNRYIKNIIINSSIIGILILCFGSCKKFLDKNPLDQISSPTFWKTQNDADLALAGCYSRLNVSSFIFEGKIALDILAGDANEGSQSLGTSSTGVLAQGTIESTSGGLVNNIYNQS